MDFKELFNSIIKAINPQQPFDNAKKPSKVVYASKKTYGKVLKLANISRLKLDFLNQEDFKTRTLVVKDKKATLIYLDSMATTEVISQFIIEPLVAFPCDEVSLTGLLKKTVTGVSGEILTKYSDILSKVLNGYSVIFLEGQSNECISFDTRTEEGRSVIEPPTSSVSKGPREGFVENYKINLTLLKKRLKTETLKIQEMTVGRLTQTKVGVCWLSNIADNKTVKRIIKKIQNIDIDGIIDSSYIARFLDADKTGYFKLVGGTEKPDIVAAKMLEGRVCIIVDGSPIVLTLPYLFIEDLQSSEDYYESSRTATAGRILRVLSIVLAIMIPALYVSLQTFNYQILPAKFLISIITATQNIPFKPFEEMLLVLVLFDILREANFRMPRFAGISLSVVGAVVLGDAAVKAGLLGAPAVMIGALSGIGLYTMPENTLLFSILRMIFLLVGSLMGLYGLMLFGLALLAYVTQISAFGTPYIAPFAPDILTDKQDAIVKSPLEKLKKRPLSIRNNNEIRQA